MNIYEITFSPAGGTQKVLDIVAGSISAERTNIDLTDRDVDFDGFHFKEDDICIIAVPSYGGRVPDVAVSRLKSMNGGGAAAVLITVYGNRDYEDTLLELKDGLDEAGFHCTAAVAAVAKHSIMPKIAADRPDEEDEELLKSFAGKIKEHLSAETSSDELYVPGHRPYREYNGVPLKPKAGKACTKCGICTEKCPVGAIPEDPKKTDKDKCISCMRCVNVCPNNARSLNKLVLGIASKKMEKMCSERKKDELFI
ncbi:MAG: 4Fe-4S binding protein [Eubacteriaceae bacterium]|nr:4Fe-4S binding protein [Eubacteriaceae bacterium]